ncbi:HAD superfamily hydrolase (TIGR01457 family) [Caldicellulosiruptor bescii]|uniref:Acid sugar phosphatase n=2 Tax=Caldicellulosiruptor bescii TaxID=31899 RepID=B9MN01_CALBD|nr:HAD-IIA family hydrolase [Caldicellulosiruptor bescii]ACM59457.1 HAD-superfamily hydrolase, subfamily IIA [Caldicellulosiruptor bescii DSM 6725]PBC89811.1 HAD superfamily hydrolase (TIGR01457 family) [Caldicellulosiruptor bescii]PBD04762.1 HAD superfamily hydrolase (TIGR01457 family) [Caldicellulosiruptor bescii]PBD05607.1 HAD superfamily hydrolase (TIGR01457 family) [Caldicellulosiruptor bescii]PFH15878.1 HAD superfamily hydrolase (TIGR01457 family) [Caldicellulosiruptor bescii]
MKNSSILKNIDLFLLDLDGTVYLGEKVFEGAREFIKLLNKNQKEFLFLTNNSSKSSEEYYSKLLNMGFEITKENVFTSGQAMGIYIKTIHKKEKPPRVYVVGTTSLKRELKSMGIVVVDSPNYNIDYLVIGFDTTLTYKKLLDACELIRRGVPFLATNPDLVCPLDGGRYIPDCGSICIMLENATKKKPVFVGKPSSIMVDIISNLKKVEKSRIAMIGDRLYTDMKMAKDSGMVAALVLSGETKMKDVEASTLKPDLIYGSIKDMYEELKLVFGG